MNTNFQVSLILKIMDTTPEFGIYTNLEIQHFLPNIDTTTLTPGSGFWYAHSPPPLGTLGWNFPPANDNSSKLLRDKSRMSHELEPFSRHGCDQLTNQPTKGTHSIESSTTQVRRSKTDKHRHQN